MGQSWLIFFIKPKKIAMYSPAVFCQIINIMLNRGGELDCMRICDFFLDLVFSVVFDGFVGCDGFVFLDYVCD